MKIIFTSLFVLSFLLSACAPSVIPPTATLTPFPTATPTLIPTLTPTATPIAVDGVAEVDGLLYVFDEQTQNWVALPPLPEGMTLAKVGKDGSVGAYDSEGMLTYVLNGTEWEKAKPRYEYLSYNPQFDAALKQMVEGGAFPEDLSTVERLHYEDGSEVPFGYLGEFGSAEQKFFVISGVMGQGWINPADYDATLVKDMLGMPLLMVPMSDGRRVVLTPVNVGGDLPRNVGFFEGRVDKQKPWNSPDLVFDRTTGAGELSYIRQQTGLGGELVGKQVMVVFNSKMKDFVGFEEYNKDLDELIRFLQGRSGGDLKWNARTLFMYIWYLPNIPTRP
jgi:hypothetical protein